MIRFFDFFISSIGLIILSPLLVIIFFFLFFENGSPLFRQKRLGLNRKHFILIKFRTMPIKTKSTGTHLIKDIKLSYSGYLLRRTKLDELPQLYNVLVGHMSLVGPRPCLLNQKRLISERKKRKIFSVKPGITGLAQLKGVNMAKPLLLSKIDLEMIQKKINIMNYFKYISLTFLMILK